MGGRCVGEVEVTDRDDGHHPLEALYDGIVHANVVDVRQDVLGEGRASRGVERATCLVGGDLLGGERLEGSGRGAPVRPGAMDEDGIHAAVGTMTRSRRRPP